MPRQSHTAWLTTTVKPYHYLSPNCLLTLMVAACLSSACGKAGEAQLGVKPGEKRKTPSEVSVKDSKAEATPPPPKRFKNEDAPSQTHSSSGHTVSMDCENPDEKKATYLAEETLDQKLRGASAYYASAREAMKIAQRHVLASVFILPVIREHQAELDKFIKSFGAVTSESEQVESIIKMNKFVQSWPFLETDFTEFLESLSLPPSTQFELGWCYENGCGVDKDEKQAVYWYRKATEQGDADAQCNLGVCYKRGRGIDQDAKQAAEWYRKAAEQNHALAQNNLGWCYANGYGAEKDEKQAVEWYRKAAAQGDVDAQNNLGRCYANGCGVDKDEKEAVAWFRKAVQQGHASAQNNLGWYYESGCGVEKNFKEAEKWYRKAAEQNYALALYNLGRMCEDRLLEVQDGEKEAADWFAKAAAQGMTHKKFFEIIQKTVNKEESNDTAQYCLGQCYAKGRGVEQNTVKSLECFKKSAEQGNKLAKAALQSIKK